MLYILCQITLYNWLLTFSTKQVAIYIPGKFGIEFNLAVWYFDTTAKLNFVNLQE